MTSCRKLRSLLGGAVLVAGVVILHGPAATALPGPSSRGPADIGRWIQHTDPAIVAATLLRWLAIGFGWYCLATAALAVVARLTRRRRLIRAVDRLCISSVRALAAGIAGTSLTIATIASAAGAQPVGGAADQPPTMHQVATTDANADAARGPTLHQVAPEPSRQTLTSASPRFRVALVETTAPPSDEPSTPTAAANVTPREDIWTVESGDHLWSIAERVLTQHAAAEPTLQVVEAYWQRLVRTNRAGLADPSNPDLLYVGQSIVLPPLLG